MPTYITLVDFTDKGIQHIKATCQREQAFAAAAQNLGVTVKQVFWTVGGHDGVLVLEAPDVETVTAAVLAVGALGNVRTHTLRAFTAAEMQNILDRIP